jgi:anti-anti-sigma factor
MNINKIQDSGKLTFTLDGRLDTTTAPQLQEVLIPAFDETGEVELNFAQVSYVSSAGLRVLLLGQKAAEAKNALMIVSNASEEILEVFEMTGFSEILTFK